MKFLHTSDWHLGLSLGGFSLLREQEEMCAAIVAIAKEEHVDAVLLAGDVFDRAVSSADAIALYDRTITALIAAGIQVFVIAGNHDGAARLSVLSELLAPAGLHLAGSLTARPSPVFLGDTAVFSVSFFHLEQVRLLYPEREIAHYEDAMRALMDEVRAVDAVHRVVLAHCFVTGASLTESDVGARLGGAQQIGAAVFEGIDYVALGHLHTAQTLGANAHYSGSPYPYSFGETQKSVRIYDTKTRQETVRLLDPSRTLCEIRDTFEAVSALPPSDDYLKIELTDRGAGLEALSLLRERFPNLVTLLGKTAKGQKTTITAEELHHLSPDALVGRFCEEIGGFSPEKELIDAFLETLAAAQKGGGAQ